MPERGAHRLAAACRLALTIECLAALVVSGQPAPASSGSLGKSQPTAGEHEELLTVTHARIPSKAFQTARDVSIWLPDGTDPATRYPVVVFPDAEEKGQFRSALANIQFLVDRRLIPPLLVVGVPYLANRRHELTPRATGSTARLYPAAGGADQTLHFMADELLPWIDAHYPTLPTRVLVGHSLGGLFALYAMTTRPDVFRIVLALSAPVDWNDGAFGTQAANSLATDTLSRTLFLTSGGLEPPIDEPTTVFAAHLTALLDSLHTNHLRFERRRYPRDTHEMTPLPGLVDGLRMAFDPVLVPIDSVIGELAKRHVRDSSAIHATAQALESRYAAGTKTLGIPGPFPEAALDVLGGYSLEANQPALALTLLSENRDRYPLSSNAHESVGEALVAVGDTTKAVGEFHTAIAIATAQLQKPGTVLTHGHERDVRAAALAQLQALHKNATSAAR